MAQSWSTAVKLALPLLVAMAMASAPSAAHDEVLELAEAAPLAKAAGRGRFLSSFDGVTPVLSGRRHLLNGITINTCGPGTSDQCQQTFGKVYKIPKCCKDSAGNSACYDTGVLLDKCGSCTNKCSYGEICCNGKCTNLESDSSNCGACGKVCKGVSCIKFMCGYNGKP